MYVVGFHNYFDDVSMCMCCNFSCLFYSSGLSMNLYSIVYMMIDCMDYVWGCVDI